MNVPINENRLDQTLAGALGSPPAADFEAWRRQHPEALACIDPQRMAASLRKRRLLGRAAKLAAVAAALACLWIGLSHVIRQRDGGAVFAQVVEQIKKAKTITWKRTRYDRFTSMDGEREWLLATEREFAYKCPGLYRETTLDEKSEIESVRITDAVRRKTLSLYPTTKEAILSELVTDWHSPDGPFHLAQKRIKEANLQWVKTRKSPAGEINVFREVYGDHEWSQDYWIDQKTKRLVEVHEPGEDLFDPEKDPARANPPERESSRISGAGHIDRDIVFDAELDDLLFRLEPPKGYTVRIERRAQVTEKDMVDFLGLMADFNDKTFPDYPWVATAPESKTSNRPEKERMAAKERLLEAINRYDEAGVNPMPIDHFVQDRMVEKSFRYLGKGVKVGDKDRIVCWYRLKGSKTYRAVYGDLSIKDVAPEDLPLPIDP